MMLIQKVRSAENLIQKEGNHNLPQSHGYEDTKSRVVWWYAFGGLSIDNPKSRKMMENDEKRHKQQDERPEQDSLTTQQDRRRIKMLSSFLVHSAASPSLSFPKQRIQCSQNCHRCDEQQASNNTALHRCHHQVQGIKTSELDCLLNQALTFLPTLLNINPHF